MATFIPPPAFTTVRFNPRRIGRKQAIAQLEDYVQEEIASRNIPKHHRATAWKVERHPVINDVLLVPTIPLTDVRPCTDEVIVDRSCGMAILRGAHVFAPGIIGAPQYMKLGDSVAVFSDLDGRCLKGSTAKYTGEKLFVGNGVAEISRETLFVTSADKVGGIGIRMKEPLYLTPCLDQKSLPDSFFLQNLPSIVAGHVLDPQPGDTILDMCAAPGGKATHLCSLLHGDGCVIALDRSRKKVEKIRENTKRQGYSDILFAFDVDSRKIVSEDASSGGNLNPDKSPPFPPEYFAKILLDAPCSALGQRPRLSKEEEKSKTALSSYPALQWQLFKTAVRLLRRGGTLVYSTCTTTNEENEGMVEKALNEYQDLCLVPQVPHVGATGRKMSSGLSDDKLSMLQYFPMLPDKRESSHPADKDTIGFFIAKFKKILK